MPRLPNFEESFMNRRLTGILLAAAVASACSAGSAKTKEQSAAPPSIPVAAAAAVERPIARFIRATGTLMAEEQADVAAETAGRVVSAPVERGTPVTQGAELIRLLAAETDAQLKEAEANAAQLEARLGISGGSAMDVNAVPEVQNAKAGADLAQAEFAPIKSLLDQRVVSQSEFEQRRTQLEAMRQQYEAARNGAAQQYQSLQAARDLFEAGDFAEEIFQAMLLRQVKQCGS
jgi:multidrug efflux pump subunit AcrA (membrane-fusion protein)